ncbi:MAG: hypothetical protein KF832_03525 [Caldilineaceae bacterium]|nr:hypothetical protein [Caldilineaceae bacterium]
MLPPSHLAYTWLTVSLAQEYWGLTEETDYRLIALAAVGSDLIDKPLALAYFYQRYKAAVLFAHTLLVYLALCYGTYRYFPRYWRYTLAFVGHALIDRLWLFPATFYWPFRGWRFHVWGKRGAEQTELGRAYWVTFTRRPELWGWEVGGLLALGWFVWRHQLYRGERLRRFLRTGRVSR